MEALVVDLTHGGVTIALALREHCRKVFAWDIYNSLNEENKKSSQKRG
ncbi:MAG: hypothetical protein IPG26_06985 [Coprothermobacter sp.]|nr:hypothetical protein [Coprothermobacter sp.]